jgi:GTPase
VRGWTHLERQRGGIGGRGGPGEKQIELDRRMIGERVKRLKQQLAKIETQRNTQRRSRQKGRDLRVAIVGYTNAGKSTLFNRVTREKTLAQDKLFATLDTTTRRVYIAGPADEHGMTQGVNITLTDTVGFIRDLPHTLVDAFKATLEETIEADYLLHVVDASNPAHLEQMNDVRAVLAEIGAGDLPEIVTYNKIDRRTGVEGGVFSKAADELPTVHVSALTGAGIEALRSYLHTLAAGSASIERYRRDEVAREVQSSDYFKPGRALNTNQNIENGTIHPDLLSSQSSPEASTKNLR